MKILLTGIAGFIGSALAHKLLDHGHYVTGIDNLFGVDTHRLKDARLKELGIDSKIPGLQKSSRYDSLTFIRMDITEQTSLFQLMEEEKFDKAINLAARTGVRGSAKDPAGYVSTNIGGFINMLEGCRIYGIKHLLYASSSSVYGRRTEYPFTEDSCVDTPASIYAATKRSDELLAYTYWDNYNLPSTGLRFFSVYGPWGRPDMAPMLFLDALNSDKTVNVFGRGELKRDFTYIDDVTEALVIVTEKEAPHEFRTYNIGMGKPVSVNDLLALLERITGKRARRVDLPMQTGDVELTYADHHAFQHDFGFSPTISLEEGLRRFCNWYYDFKS